MIRASPMRKSKNFANNSRIVRSRTSSAVESGEAAVAYSRERQLMDRESRQKARAANAAAAGPAHTTQKQVRLSSTYLSWHEP